MSGSTLALPANANDPEREASRTASAFAEPAKANAPLCEESTMTSAAALALNAKVPLCDALMIGSAVALPLKAKVPLSSASTAFSTGSALALPANAKLPLSEVAMIGSALALPANGKEPESEASLTVPAELSISSTIDANAVDVELNVMVVAVTPSRAKQISMPKSSVASPSSSSSVHESGGSTFAVDPVVSLITAPRTRLATRGAASNTGAGVVLTA